jgi:hypothetical protein
VGGAGDARHSAGINKMDKQYERIKEILGKDCERNSQNAIRYLTYLKETVKTPCLLTGIEDFLWEEPYVIGGWDNREYQELKKNNPSFTDQFELLELLPPNSGDDDIIAKVKRISDQKIFEIGLSWLECADFMDMNYQFIHDYAVWHTNY